MIRERRDFLLNVIFALVVDKLIRKGCKAYLANILDMKLDSAVMKNIRVVKEFSNVFPKELPDLPLEHEVKFCIKLLPRTYRCPLHLHGTKGA